MNATQKSLTDSMEHHAKVMIFVIYNSEWQTTNGVALTSAVKPTELGREAYARLKEDGFEPSQLDFAFVLKFMLKDKLFIKVRDN